MNLTEYIAALQKLLAQHGDLPVETQGRPGHQGLGGSMFKMEFDTGNAAFDDGCGPAEVARILRVAAVRIDGGTKQGVVADVNGNRIGTWSVEYAAEGEGDED